MKNSLLMLNRELIIFYSKVSLKKFCEILVFNIFSVFSNNKVKEDSFLGQCELPLVPTLPELNDDSPPSLGQKDCILRLVTIHFYYQLIMDHFRPRVSRNRVRGHIKIRLRYLPDPSWATENSTTVRQC